MVDWMNLNHDSIVAATNFTTVVMMMLLGSTALYIKVAHNYREDSDISTILLGVAVEAYAWAGHRLYWGTWRAFRSWGLDGVGEWMLYHSYITMIPSLLVIVGLALILSPFWGVLQGNRATGKRHYLIPAAFVLSLWWFFWLGITQQNVEHLSQIEMFGKPIPGIGK